MIDLIEVNNLIRQLDYSRTKLYSHDIWYLTGKIKEYYKYADQEILAEVIRICRECLYKIQMGADSKIWEKLYDYMYDHYCSKYNTGKIKNHIKKG